MANRSKNQHWVPRFYLRYFATPETRRRGKDKSQLWMFSNDETDGDERLTNVRNVCTRRYLYSPTDRAGLRDWALEEKLAGLETQLASLWPTLAAKPVDFGDADIRRLVALFVSVMHLRGPDTLNGVGDIHRNLVSLLESAPKHPDGTPNVEVIDASGNAKALDTKGWREYRQWGANDHLRFFARTIQSEAVRIAECLMRKRWSTILADDDAFVTSDRPVSIEHQAREACGVATPGSIVTFPLTPRRLLMMDDRHEQPANQYYPLKRNLVGTMNALIWRSGRFLLTGRPIPEVLAELVSSAEAAN